MITPARKITLHGMLLQFPYWFGCCTYFAFIITTLIDNGWSGSTATAAITAMSVIAMLTQPFIGYISDKLLSEKKLVIILLIVASVCFLLLPLSLASGNMVLVFINMGGITMSAAQCGGLIDAWIVGLKQEYPDVNYGLIRGSGSLSFALSAQVTGMLTIAFGHDVRMWVGGGALIVTLLVALTFRSARRAVNEETVMDTTQENLQEESQDEITNTSQESTEKTPAIKLTGIEAIKILFSSKQYNLLLAVSFFLLLSNTTMLTLIQLLVRDFGGTAAQMGTATAIMAGSEVPFMFLMALILRKIGFKKLLLFCSMVYLVRMLVTASVSTVDGLIYVQMLQGLTYAILIPLSMSYLSQILDERIRSTAVTTFASVTVGLTGILGNLITATLLANGFSAQTALIVFSLSALIGLFLTVYGIIRKIW